MFDALSPARDVCGMDPLPEQIGIRRESIIQASRKRMFRSEPVAQREGTDARAAAGFGHHAPMAGAQVAGRGRD